MSSRIIVKNLPKHANEERLRAHFSLKGIITDIKLSKTPDGRSRRFAYIGYRSVAEAEAAVKYFHNTFMDTSKICVEIALSIGNKDLPRSWSKYTKAENGTTTNISQAKLDAIEAKKLERQKQKAEYEKNKNLLFSIYQNEANSKLNEYLSVMQPKSKTRTWMNEDLPSADSQIKNSKANQRQVKLEMVKSKKLGGDAVNLTKMHVKFDDDSDDEENDDLYQSLGDIKNMLPNEQDFKAIDDNLSDEENGMIANSKLDKNGQKEIIRDTGRLFVRNLPFTVTDSDLTDLFNKFGPISEIHLPLTKDTKQVKGFAYVQFMMPENAVVAFEKLDGSIFMGRIVHIIGAAEKPGAKQGEDEGKSFKQKKAAKIKAAATSTTNWNSLFMNSDSVVESIAKELKTSKSDVLSPESENLATRLAIAETHIINETKKFLEEEGICLDVFEKTKNYQRSDTIILVKNIPYETTTADLRQTFGKHGTLLRVLIPPTKTIAVIEFAESVEAKVAFKQLAYSKFKKVPLYLEWAPIGLFRSAPKPVKVNQSESMSISAIQNENTENNDHENENNDEDNENTIIFVKNLNFSTSEESLANLFKSFGPILSARISTKKDPKNPEKKLSMGFGFVEFKRAKDAKSAILGLNGAVLDNHALNLKFSNAAVSMKKKAEEESKSNGGNNSSTKIIVRNVPFEATVAEIKDLFKTFGQLKKIRLPKKFDGTHRGFCFVEFLTKKEAEKAFKSLFHTHLYGRHLVLEWAKDEDVTGSQLTALRAKTARDKSHIEINLKKRKVESLIGGGEEEGGGNAEEY